LNSTDTGADSGIATTNDTTLGYNTTSGGTKHLRVVPLFNSAVVSAQFSFATPVESFGAYLTGLGTASGNLFIQFNDGSSQSLPVAGSASGGVQFFGFTDAGKPISSVTAALTNVGATRDIFGIDDVRFTFIPEPAGALSLAIASTAAMMRRRRFARR
jgi:hypothetical protein